MTRTEMAKQIVAWEARRDSFGRLRVYLLPPNDGGGAYEVAGINERYDPVMAKKLKVLIEEGAPQDAEVLATEYIARTTDPAATWTNLPAIEFFLRDTIFNRGVTGAAKILQAAAKAAPIDGAIGPISRAAVAYYEKKPLLFLARLRVARENYERDHVGTRDNFSAGLTNRWDNALEASATILAAA